jgi:outer membrane protein TolC
MSRGVIVRNSRRATRRISLVVFAWALALSGCASGSRFRDRAPFGLDGAAGSIKAPTVAVRAQHSESDELEPEAQEVSGSTGALVPFAGSGPEQTVDLQGALRAAGLDNPTIALAEEAVRANLAEQTLARSLLFPSLHGGATLSLHQGNLLSAQGIMRNLERESLFFGGPGPHVRGGGTVAVPGIVMSAHLGDAVLAPQVARQKVLSSSFDALAARNNVLLQVANAYLALVGAEARVLALGQSRGELAEVVTLTANFAAKGQGREGDALRARSAALLLDGTELKASEDAAAWNAELARLMSTDPAVRLRPPPGTPPLFQFVDPQTPLETLIGQALAQRPEVAARGADVALFETRLRQERLRPLVPTLFVGFSAGDFGGGSSQVPYRFSNFGSRTDFDVLAVWSVENLGFGNRAVQNKVRAEIGQAEAQRALTIDRVRREVAEALARTSAARREMDIAQKRTQTAQQAFRQDLERAKNLQGRIIEVLDSFNMLTSARQDFIATMTAYTQAQFDLWTALGNVPVA